MAQPARQILVVDDDPLVRKSLTRLLSDAGFQVLVAANAEDALALTEEQDFAVAVVDKNLGGELNGLDILARIRARYATLVILHTGYPSTDSAIQALRSGAFDYLSKPTDHDLLVEKVRRAAAVYDKELHRAELFRNYETLFEVVPGMVWFATDEGVLKRVSEQGANLLGYSASDLVGKSYLDILAPETRDPGAHWAFKERRTGRRATQRKIIELQTRAGERRIVELSAAAAYDQSRPVGEKSYRGTLAVGWDITDNVRMFEVLQQSHKMDVLGRLAGGVAHDFNNLLSIILGNVELVLPHVSEVAAAKKGLLEVADAGQRGAALTRQLLQFSRQEAVRLQPVDVAAVVTNLRRMLARLVREDIELRLDVLGDELIALADPGQLEQVIVNLVANASDAMPGGGALTTRVESVEFDAQDASDNPSVRAGRFVMIAVTDTGRGMSQEVVDRLFEPFFTTKDAEEGTGLGLAIVYGIVCQAHGFIVVDSEIGCGTTVKVYLPVGKVGARPPSSAPPPGDLSGTEHVLLAEDDAIVRSVAHRILSEAGYAVTEVATGTEGLAARERIDELDLLVTDVVMPGMNGVELSRRLRERDPDLPVLYLSGYLGDLTENYGLLIDRARFLAKPLSRVPFLAAVRTLLDASSGAG
jgi:two-component system cell cycle sensor histidine kinase/response regulator CckA